MPEVLRLQIDIRTFVVNIIHPFVYNSCYHYTGYRVAQYIYSGLKNHCNVFQFWSGCDVALEEARMTLSIGRVK